MKLQNVDWMEVALLSLVALAVALPAISIYLTIKHDCTCIKKGNPTYVIVGRVIAKRENCIEWDCKKQQN